MKKFNVYKIEGDEKTLVRENVSMSQAIARIKYEQEEAGLMDVYEMKTSAATRLDDADVVTYQVFDAEPAYEVRLADKRLNVE